MVVGGKNVLDIEGSALRLRNEALRMAEIRAASLPPAECGPDIVAAPARGPSIAVHRIELVPQGGDKWAAATVGYGGRAAVRAADVFDLMLAAAVRAKRPAPLTPGQIAHGRRYRDLVELVSAGGLKLSSLGRLAAGSGGGQSDLDWLDRHLSLVAEVDAMRRRVGSGVSMAVRRVRPSARGSRVSIPDQAIVDMVCIGDRSLSQVLRAHGWATHGAARDALLLALCGALDRMIGYRG